MNFPTIMLIVISIIVFLIIIIDIILAINIKLLNKKIMKRDNVIFSLLAQQYDLILILAKMIKDEGVELPEDLLISLNLHEQQKALSTMERLNIKKSIHKTANGLILVGETTRLKDDQKFIVIRSSLNSFNLDYRKEVVLYNQDIYAYNYWINFLFFRVISKIFKMQKKEYIQ